MRNFELIDNTQICTVFGSFLYLFTSGLCFDLISFGLISLFYAFGCSFDCFVQINLTCFGAVKVDLEYLDEIIAQSQNRWPDLIYKSHARLHHQTKPNR